MRIITRTALIGVLLLAAFSSYAQSTDLTELYGQHRWFELREAIRNDRRTTTGTDVFFDGLSPVTRVAFWGTELDFVMDTGSVAGTQFWERARGFATLLGRGTKSKQTLTQVGGPTEQEVTVLPEIRLRVGEFEAMLVRAAIIRKPVGDDFHYGLLGMRVYRKARRVRIDFRYMKLELTP